MTRPRLLFVCVENSCRSQMAEAFARLLAGDRVDALLSDLGVAPGAEATGPEGPAGA